jgi:translocator protein
MSCSTRLCQTGEPLLLDTMSYIPSLTLPDVFFSSPALSILLPVTAGSAVGFLCRPSETKKTYFALKQPPYRPPPSVFGPVWTGLYALMGYAANRAWTVGMASAIPSVVENTRIGTTLYSIQLGLNLVWMPLFFVKGWPIPATLDIVALAGTVGYIKYLWGKIDDTASYCLMPYLGWLGFATYLCVGVGHLNGWNFQDKIKRMETKAEETKFVDEEPEGGSMGV